MRARTTPPLNERPRSPQRWGRSGDVSHRKPPITASPKSTIPATASALAPATADDTAAAVVRTTTTTDGTIQNRSGRLVGSVSALGASSIQGNLDCRDQ